MRKQQRSRTKPNRAAAKSTVQDERTRLFRDLLAAEELLQSTIQALVSLGAGEFTSGLSIERHRLLAKLDSLQDDVYLAFDNPANMIVRH